MNRRGFIGRFSAMVVATAIAPIIKTVAQSKPWWVGSGILKLKSIAKRLYLHIHRIDGYKPSVGDSIVIGKNIFRVISLSYPTDNPDDLIFRIEPIKIAVINYETLDKSIDYALIYSPYNEA